MRWPWSRVQAEPAEPAPADLETAAREAAEQQVVHDRALERAETAISAISKIADDYAKADQQRQARKKP